MKKIETLKKYAKYDDVISNVLHNDAILISALTDTERLKITVFCEVARALNNDTHEAILQCNYDCTKHADAHSFDLIRFVEREKHQNALCNIYISIKKDVIYCNITVSAHKTYQKALQDAQYDIVKHRKVVTLDTLTTEIKTLYAIFASVHKK